MKKNLIALAVASAMPFAAQAVEVDFGGDANVEGYTIQRGESQDGAENDESIGGWSQRIRAKMHFKGDGGVSVNTRLVLSDTAWKGDNPTPIYGTATSNAGSAVAGAYRSQNNEAVTLDYGYVQFPVAGWTVRVGRQEANWGFCLTTCDDRRDRVLAMRKFGSTTILALYDKRAEGSGLAGDDYTNDPFEVDRDMYGLAAVGFNNGWLWGALLAHWQGEELDGDNSLLPVFDPDAETGFGGATLAAIFAKGKIGPVAVKGALHYLSGTSYNNEGIGVINSLGVLPSAYPNSTANGGAYATALPGEGGYYSDSSFAGMGEGSWAIGNGLTVDGLWIFALDGGLITNGIDTYSMFINNSPDNNRSNTNILNIGAGWGAAGYDEHLFAARIKGSSGSYDWYASAGIYMLDWENSDDEVIGGDINVEANATFFQVGGAYNLTKSTNIYADLGTLNGDADFDTEGDSDVLEEDITYTALRVGINTSF